MTLDLYTHMAGNLSEVIWKMDTVATHFVHQIFPEDDNFLGAVLNPVTTHFTQKNLKARSNEDES